MEDVIEQTVKQLAAADQDARRWRWFTTASISEREKISNLLDPVAMNAYIDAHAKGVEDVPK